MDGVQRLTFVPLSRLEGGEQIEITLRTRSEKGGTAKFAIRQMQESGAPGPALDGTSYDINIGAGAREVRLIVRSQLPAQNLMITFDAPAAMTIENVMALRETEQIARVHRGVRTGQRHRGGVTFAVLD